MTSAIQSESSRLGPTSARAGGKHARRPFRPPDRDPDAEVHDDGEEQEPDHRDVRKITLQVGEAVDPGCHEDHVEEART